jgi:hypothetical protein
MNYEETVELEKNVKLKDEAERICRDFHKNIKLDCAKYRGDSEFVLWEDSHNHIYVSCGKKYFGFHCRFLHETYDITVSPSAVFSALKSKNRVIEHLRSSAANQN